MLFLLALLIGVFIGATVWALFGRRILDAASVLIELLRNAAVPRAICDEISEGHPRLSITKRVREMTGEFETEKGDEKR